MLTRRHLLATSAAAALLPKAAPAQTLDSRTEGFRAATGAPAVGLGVWADGEAHCAVAGTRTTRGQVAAALTDAWHIGSLTKSMTSLLAGRLVAKGTLGWGTTLADLLGDEMELHPRLAPARLDALLSHRSGMVANLDWVSARGLSVFGDVGRARTAYARAVLTRAPDPAGPYSNAGYVVAGLMLTAATGTPWEDLIRTEVFAPLGLGSAGFGPPAALEGHRLRGDRLEPMGRGARADNPAYLGPAGTVHIALCDLVRYAGAHLRRDPAYLPQEVWDALHRDHGNGFGLGWQIDGDELRHRGSNTLWLAQITLWPARRRAAIAVANSGDLTRLVPVFANEIAALG